jgi:hypothetical protein
MRKISIVQQDVEPKPIPLFPNHPIPATPPSDRRAILTPLLESRPHPRDPADAVSRTRPDLGEWVVLSPPPHSSTIAGEAREAGNSNKTEPAISQPESRQTPPPRTHPTQQSRDRPRGRSKVGPVQKHPTDQLAQTARIEQASRWARRISRVIWPVDDPQTAPNRAPPLRNVRGASSQMHLSSTIVWASRHTSVRGSVPKSRGDPWVPQAPPCHREMRDLAAPSDRAKSDSFSVPRSP